MKFIQTSHLNIGYEEWNPNGKSTVVLLHGWPDSTHTWSKLAPALAKQGWRIIIPALRGFLPTTFLSASTMRSGQLSALGRDVLDLIDALDLKNPALVGHDWGARAAANACILRPGVASHLVMISVGYGTNATQQQLTLEQARKYWYHWFMATPRGEHTVREQGREFANIMWDTWSPAGWYDASEFEQAAATFDNPDWAAVTLSSYQHRWGHAPGDPLYDGDEALLVTTPQLNVPTLVIHGDSDGANAPATSDGKSHYFLNRYVRKVLAGIGHFPQREAPEQVASELLSFLG
jgi:pimeloyl-ACP methyl ester carboxylesterase